MPICSTCYEFTIPNCADNLVLTDFEADTDYLVTVTDKFGNVFVLSATSDGDGNIDVLLSSLPPYLLNPFAGAFTLSVYLTTGCNPIAFTWCEVEYTCISLTVTQTTYDSEPETRTVTVPCCPEIEE